METKILFFDDEPQSAGASLEALKKAGYKVVTPKSIEEAFHEINVGRAELLIHLSHNEKTHWSLCDQIFNQYPHFPSVHISHSEVGLGLHGNLKGPFHKKLKSITSQRDFLRVVRKLVFMGRLSRQNTELKKTVRLQNQIDKIFETLDLDELRIKTVEFFFNEFKAKNAYFLNAGGYGYYLQEMWKISPLGVNRETSAPPKHVFCAANPSSEADLSGYLSEVSDQLGSGWELRTNRTYLPMGKNKNSICFIPLVGHQTKKVLGHVMLVNPLLYGDAALERVLPYLGRVLGRHFDHAFNFTNAKNLTYIDDLTNLYNQRYLKLVIDKEISRASREDSPFSVLFMDIDHFKQVNDTRGHLIGSKVLIELSKILNQHIRLTDYGFRYGGDEFILILVGTGSNQAMSVAERIRKHVEASSFDVNGSQINVTLSIGIATYPDHATTREEIIQLADRAMYCGKNKSRNVVYVAS